jgi:AcrR family transcriptional regulator
MVKRGEKAIERKADILKTARLLFETEGYENATMQELMKRLDIAKGTIYHYFPSKEALLEAVIEEIVSANIKQMEALIAERGTALEKIKALITMGNLTVENADILQHLHKPGNEAMHLRLLVAILAKQAPLYAKLIQQGCEEGIFQTEYPLECAEMILSSIQFLTDLGIYPWTNEEIKRRMQAFPKLIGQLLSAPAGSFQFLTNQN